MRILIAAASAAACLLAQDRPREIQQRNDAYGDRLEMRLRKYVVDEYPQRAARLWNRSYASIPAFQKSVQPNRERYRRFLKPPAWKRSGAVERKPHAPLAEVGAEWISIPLGGIHAEGVLAIPANASPAKPVPLVVAQHGIGSTPELVFGLYDPRNAYKNYGGALLREGFAVLAPFNLATVEKRNRIERLARLAGTTLPGIEFARMQALLDFALEDKRIDPKRVGMWGISLGGMATMFWMPLEPRIQAGIVCAWFNHRRNKMAVPDERYSCFLETREEHAFFDGWLTEFTDADVISLMVPRPVLVQSGKKDRIAHWPQILEEFEESKTHYQRLGIADRIEMDLQDGGHEIHLESGIPFLRKWLLSPKAR